MINVFKNKGMKKIKFLGITIFKKITSTYSTKYKILFFSWTKLNVESLSLDIINKTCNDFHSAQMNFYGQLKSAKFIHFVNNDKFIKNYIFAIDNNFDLNDHIFVISHDILDLPRITYKNVYDLKTTFNLDSFENLNINLRADQFLICHSLFLNGIIQFFMKNTSILKNNSYWFMWGGDFYDVKRDFNNDFVRCNFYGYNPCCRNDVEELTKRYDIVNKNFSFGLYYDPLPLSLYKDINKFSKKKDYIKIQINNSCDKSTLHVLDMLSKYANHNIVISTVLSYGDLSCKNEIIKKGKMLFGNKFIYLDKFISPTEFFSILSENDILICNQNRQQGLFNVFASLLLGKKVYIRNEISSTQYVKDNGGITYDTNEINLLDYSNFIQYPIDIKETNIKVAEKIFSEELFIKSWINIFGRNKKCDIL